MQLEVGPREARQGSSVEVALPWRVGLRLSLSGGGENLKEIKAVADDCLSYGYVLLGLEIKAAHTNSFLAQVPIAGPIHIIEAVDCSVSAAAKQALKKISRAYTSEILKGMSNTPNLFSSTSTP